MNAPMPVPQALANRYVRYDDLKPCTTAFIDTRTPGSAQKENFTIIGPGVSESPDQHVHIDIPHGFNLGAARQPPGCVNSQHSHETAEVFFVHSGTWAFTLGEHGDDGRVVLGPGDTISIPVHVFRGFENVGDDTGILYAVLGGDDPGRVLWAPYVFQQAREYGLILLEDGSLVDTTRGETIPDGKSAQDPTTPAQVAALRRMTSDDLGACVVRGDAMHWQPAAAGGDGVMESPVIGNAAEAEGLPAAPLHWSHGFHLRGLQVAAGAQTPWHQRDEAEVIVVQRGALRVWLPDGALDLRAGDIVTVPIGAKRRFSGTGDDGALAMVVRGSDQPSAPVILD
ncbi:MAG: cupin domain-containing protein [Pseudomonadota bacterium]